MVVKTDLDELALMGEYPRMLRDRELTEAWSLACKVLGCVPGAAPVASMPPISLGADSGITGIAMRMKDSWEGVGSNLVSPLAWAHISSLCLPESVVQAQHRTLLFSHFINLGFGGALVPRLIVGRGGLPAVVAHIYAVPLRGTEWKFDLTDVDNHTIRNVALRLMYQVARVLQRAGPRDKGEAYYVRELWNNMRIEYEQLDGVIARGMYDSEPKGSLDYEFTGAGFVRRCAMSFDDVTINGQRAAVDIFAALLHGLPNADLRAELAEAYVGRSLAHWDFAIDPGLGEPSHLVANVLRALRSLPADWMRTEAMRRLHSDPSTTQYSPAIFATKVPMPQELKHYRYYDPHTRPSSGGLSSAQLEIGVTTVRAARGVTQLFGVVHILLERLEKEINLAASAAMPPRMFATRYWCHWFDQYGIVSFRRK
jgi:hypothetical protein